MTSYQFFMDVSLESYMVVWKRLIYGIVKRTCVFLEPYIGVWEQLQAYIVLSKWLHISVFYGRFFRVIYGCLETAHIWLSETHMRFLEPYIGFWERLQAYIFLSKWLHISVFYGRFFRVIYGRLETAHIWLSETHMRFFRAIYRRLETTLYQCFQTLV